MAIDKLALYNRALRIVGERKLSVITEDHERRYRLDDAWDFNAVDYCLELVKPRFATRVDNLVSPTTAAEHGFDNVFTLPSDYVAMVAVYSSATLDEPITKYLIEGNTIAVKNHTSIYVRYTSNDASYGTNYAAYPSSFAEVVSHYLAQQITPRTKPDAVEAISTLLAEAVEVSRNRDGEEEPAQWAPDRTIPTSVTQLGIYNRALRTLGIRSLGSLTEENEIRYRLDDAWGFGTIRYCLEVVKPRFATRVAKLTSSTTSTQHGFTNVYTLPSDYVAMVGAYSSDKLDEPIKRYFVEGRNLAADYGTIYIRYTSSDASYGADLTIWPTTVAEVAAAYLAQQIVGEVKPEAFEAAAQALTAAVTASRSIDGEEEPEPWATSNTLSGARTQLSIYNRALRSIGERMLGSITEDREVRYRLDDAWNFGAVNYCLELVKPRFATKVGKLTVSTTDSDHGFDNVFDLPTDYISMVGVFSSEDLDEPVTQYFIEASTLSTNHDTIYIRYTSNQTEYGYNIAQWPLTFAEVVAAFLADQITPQIKPEAIELTKKALADSVAIARDRDGEEEPSPRSTKRVTTLTTEWYQIYNDALFMLGLPQLISVNDDSERRVRLDHAVDQGAVKFHLEDTNWTWSIYSDRIDYDVSVEPEWGFSYAFEKPGTMYRIVGVFADEYMTRPVKPYADEGDYLFCEYQTIYLQYIPNTVIPDPQLWPAYFRKLIAAHLAKVVGATMPDDVDKATLQRVDAEYVERMRNAKSNDATQAPPRRIADGDWTRSRWGLSYRGYRGRP